MGQLLQIQKDKRILQDNIEVARLSRGDLLTSKPRLEVNLEEALQKKAEHVIIYRGVINTEDVDEFAEGLQKTHRVKITDLNESTLKERETLAAHLAGTTPRKIGNIVGFLNSKRDTSYSNTKEYSRDTLEGSYEEIYTIIKMMSDVGWHKGSPQGVSAENTSLNKMMDKKGLRLAGEISRFSEKNIQTKDYPASGLIGSVQALRLKGWNDNEIKNVSLSNRLDEVVYEQYNTKPRQTSGAEEMERVMKKEVDMSKSTVKHSLSKMFKWEE